MLPHKNYLTILVVDDEDSVRMLISRLLKQLDPAIIFLAATDGVDALQKIEGRNNPPLDLAIIDLMMPRMDGAELFSRLRNIYPNLPILIISGFSDKALKATQLTKELNVAFMPKPFQLKEFIQTVEALLKNSPQQSGPNHSA